jgi:hypothetical protein
MNFLCKNPKKFDNDFDDRDFKGEGENYMKYIKAFSSDPVLKKAAINNDLEMANSWLREATSKDITLEHMTDADWRVAHMDLKARSSEIQEGVNPGFNDFKVLQAILRRMPGGGDLYKRITSIISYKNENRVENSRGKDLVMKNVASLAKEFGLDTSVISRLEAAYLQAQTKADKEKALFNLQKYLGDIATPGKKEMAGEFHRTLLDVMEGADIETLKYIHPEKGGETDYTTAQKRKFRDIRDGWASMRKNLTRTLLRGIETEIKYIKRIESRIGNQKKTSKLIEDLKTKLLDIEIKSKVKGTNKVYDLDMNDITRYNLDPAKKYQISEYVPNYVLDHFIKIVGDAKRNLENPNSDATAQDVVSKRLEDLEGSIDSMKHRSKAYDGNISYDPFYIMEKYMNDVSFYNYKTNMNEAMLDMVEFLTKMDKNGQMLATSQKKWVDDYVDEAYKVIGRIQEKSFIGTGEQGQIGNDVKRFLTSTAFFRNIGLSLSSPAQNASQRFWEIVHLGVGARGEAKTYLDSNDLQSIFHDQQRKHGLLWAEDNQSLGKIYQILKSNNATANSFRGSLEDPVIPGLRRKIVKDSSGKERVDIQIVDERAFEKVLQSIEKISAKSGALHTWVENINRAGTFKSAFARIHKNLSRQPLEWKRKEFNKPKGTEAELASLINNKAGNEAYGLTVTIHGDYSQVSKPHALTTKVGSVIGQYKHYLAFMTDQQFQIAKHGLRDIRARRWDGPDLQKMFRVGLGYTLAGLATVGTGYGFSNFIQIEAAGFASDHYKALTADPETEEGQRIIRDSLYRGGLLSNLGPSFNASMDFGRLNNWWELEEGSLFPIRKFLDEDVKDLEDSQKRYKMMGLLNGSLASAYSYSIPSFMRGNRDKAIMSELGLHPSPWMRDVNKAFNKKVLSTFGWEKKNRDKRKKRSTKALEGLLS